MTATKVCLQWKLRRPLLMMMRAIQRSLSVSFLARQDAQLSESIIKAFDYVEKATCIRLQKLREKPTDVKSMKEVDWIYITNPSGIKQCVHSNENRRIDGVQMIVFGYDCMSLGDIVHEVMHILGYSHEHLREDRDQYISILWDNIKPGYKKYFDINSVSSNQYDLPNLPYDYASILHYPARAFSKNGQITIVTEHGVKIGQREGLSEIDVEKVGLIYSAECMERNREYLLKTCPSVVKANTSPSNITQADIEEYFKDRLWPYGIVNYKLRDSMEFSAEERENIRAVFRHIQEETCIQFKDISVANNEKSEEVYYVDNESNPNDDEIGEEKINEGENDSKDPEIVYTRPRDSQEKKLLLTTFSNLTNSADKPVNDEENEINSDVDDTTEKDPNLANGNKNDTRNKIMNKNDKKIKIKANMTIIHLPVKKGQEKIKLIAPSKKLRKKKANSKRQRTTRRHAANVLVLTRSPEPGCKCPIPGKPPGDHVLEVNADCFNSVNDLLHFFVHVLGLDHQHNMHDRDSYLYISWNNLTKEIKDEMHRKLPPAASVGFPYDYQSVMHYPWLEIRNGVTNIMYPIWNDGWSMGHWQGLSSIDVQKLNLLYFSECSLRYKQDNS